MSGPWEKYGGEDGPWAKYAPVQESPTGTTGQNFAAGMGKFVSDIGQGATQLMHDVAAGVEGAMPQPIRRGVNLIDRALGLKTAQELQAKGRADIEETRRLDQPLMDTGAGQLGYFTGGVITAPFVPAAGTVKGAAMLGAGVGALNPATSWSERAGNVAIGGGAGAAGQGGINAMSRVVSPQTSPQVKTLLKEGVTPTPGQILGGSFKRAEEGFSSLPIVGDVVKGAQRRSFEDLNAAAFNRALAPIGERLPKEIHGNDAIQFAYEKLGQRYNTLLPKMKAQADDVFVNEIGSLRQMVQEGAIDPKYVAAFDRILDSKLMGKFQGQNSMSGETLKQTQEALRKEAQRLGASQDPDARLISTALMEAGDSFRGLVTRSNPKYAAELNQINTGYANFKRVQRAASGVGAEEGVFTPAQLHNAVRAMDKSKDKARFSEGNALMQDLSSAGKSVLANKLPDSGTPYRAMLGYLGMGGTGAATMGAGAAIPAAALPAMYSKPGQEVLAALLAKRPEGAATLADLLRQSGPYVGQGSAALAIQQKPF